MNGRVYKIFGKFSKAINDKFSKAVKYVESSSAKLIKSVTNIWHQVFAMFSRIYSCFKRNLSIIVVGSVTTIVLFYVVVLYLPPIVSDYSRIEFGLRYDCRLKVDVSPSLPRRFLMARAYAGPNL